MTMQTWRCGSIGCRSEAFAAGPPIHLQAIGWHVTPHDGVIVGIGPELRCPRCVQTARVASGVSLADEAVALAQRRIAAVLSPQARTAAGGKVAMVQGSTPDGAAHALVAAGVPGSVVLLVSASAGPDGPGTPVRSTAAHIVFGSPVALQAVAQAVEAAGWATETEDPTGGRCCPYEGTAECAHGEGGK